MTPFLLILLVAHIALVAIAYFSLKKSSSTQLQITAQFVIALLVPIVGPLLIRSLHAPEKKKSNNPNDFPPAPEERVI